MKNTVQNTFHNVHETDRPEYRDVICFDVGDFYSWKGKDVVDGMVRLPYQKCWLEGQFPWGARGGALACQIDQEFFYADLYYTQDGKWVCIAKVIQKSNLEYRVYTEGENNYKVSHAILGFLSSFLCALNCCNVRRIEHKPDAQLQRARAKRGKQPLYSTWTLHLDLSQHGERRSLGGTHASPRVHLRRGHIRTVGGRHVWVQPHIVGNKSAGMVDKNYAVA